MNYQRLRLAGKLKALGSALLRTQPSLFLLATSGSKMTDVSVTSKASAASLIGILSSIPHECSFHFGLKASGDQLVLPCVADEGVPLNVAGRLSRVAQRRAQGTGAVHTRSTSTMTLSFCNRAHLEGGGQQVESAVHPSTTMIDL